MGTGRRVLPTSGRLGLWLLVFVSTSFGGTAGAQAITWNSSVAVVQSDAQLTSGNSVVGSVCRGAIAHVFAQEAELSLICVERLDCSKAREYDDDLVFGWIDTSSLADVTTARRIFEHDMSGTRPDAEAAIGLGNIARLDTKFERAMKLYELAVDGAWMEYRSLLHRAECLRRTKDIEESITLSEKAINLFPSLSAGYFSRARAYRAIGENEKAIADCSKIISLNGESCGARYCRGYLYLITGQAKLAMLDATKWEELDQLKAAPEAIPDPLRLKVVLRRYGTARACKLSDILIDDIRAFDCHANIHSGFLEQLVLGLAYSDRIGNGPAQSAIARCLRKFDQTKRSLAVTLYHRAYSSVWTGDSIGAKADFATVASLLSGLEAPPYAPQVLEIEVMNCTADILNDQGRRKEAIERLLAIQAQGSATPQTCYLLGNFLILEEKHAQAIELFTAMISNPDFGMVARVRGLEGRAKANRHLTNLVGAKDDLDMAINLQPNGPGAFYERAKTYFMLLKFVSAIQDCNSFLELVPDAPLNLPAYRLRAKSLMMLSDWDLALEDLNFLVDHDPKNSENYSDRAACHISMKNLDAAAADLSLALELNRDNIAALQKLAWISSTSPKDYNIDRASAIEYATRACELTGWKDPMFIVTLAASLGSDGQYEAALKRLEQTAEMPESDNQLRKRMFKSFSAGKQYREVEE